MSEMPRVSITHIPCGWRKDPDGFFVLAGDAYLMERERDALRSQLEEARGLLREAWHTAWSLSYSKWSGTAANDRDASLDAWLASKGLQEPAAPQPEQPARVRMEPQPPDILGWALRRVSESPCQWIGHAPNVRAFSLHKAPSKDHLADRDPDGTWYWVLPAQGEEGKP